jgi:uncharacterized protein (DUF2147 family)
MNAMNTAIGLVLTAAALVADAQSTSPVGTWKTIDDATKREKSLVRIVESGGVYSGRIERLLESTMAPDAVCKECTDDRKDKPVIGLLIIRNMKQSADDKTELEGGDILDPNNGKVYKAKMKLVDNGTKLEVRGFIGISLLGRTQTWIRAE